MRFDLLVTRRATLQYGRIPIDKGPTTMPRSTARKALDLIFAVTPRNENIHIDFVCGAPLLAFDRIQEITEDIHAHPGFDPDRVELTIVTGGSLLSDAMAAFVRGHGVRFCIDCDGPPEIHDHFPVTIDGSGTTARVSHTILQAVAVLDRVMVNVAFHPDNFLILPRTLDHLSGLGLRHIRLTPDEAAAWTKPHIALLPGVYERIAQCHVRFHENETPRFINLIDDKIAMILRPARTPEKGCPRGMPSMTITPDGAIHPWGRRLASTDAHQPIGHLDSAVPWHRMAVDAPVGMVPSSCSRCSIRTDCRIGCGQSTGLASGLGNNAAAFVCASEKASVRAALLAVQVLGKRMVDTHGPHRADHLWMEDRWGKTIMAETPGIEKKRDRTGPVRKRGENFIRDAVDRWNVKLTSANTITAS